MNELPMSIYILVKDDKVYYTFPARGAAMAEDYAKRLAGENWKDSYVLFIKVGKYNV